MGEAAARRQIEALVIGYSEIAEQATAVLKTMSARLVAAELELAKQTDLAARAVEGCDQWRADWRKEHDWRLETLARVEVAEARFSALHEACKPFRAAAAQIHEAYQDDVWLWQRGERTRLTVGDLRALGHALRAERCPKCDGTHSGRYAGACDGPPTPSAPPPHKMMG